MTTSAAARALERENETRGLAGDLFVDGALGSHTAWPHQLYTDAPDQTGTCCYIEPNAIETHLRACTDAQVTARFYVIGDAAVSAVFAAFKRVVADLRVVAMAWCEHCLEYIETVTADQAAQLGVWGIIVTSVQPHFDALCGGSGMYTRRLGVKRSSELNPLALLAAQGVFLALGSDVSATDFDPWVSVQSVVNHYTPGSAVSVQVAFAAATRDYKVGTLMPGTLASYAMWDTGALDVSAPHNAVQRWSTDPCPWVLALPRLGSTDVVPCCRRTMHWGAVIYG